MEVIVLQYDMDGGLFVASEASEVETTDLAVAQQMAKILWHELEDGQPKQIFIREKIGGRNRYYYDNFQLVFKPSAA